MKKIKIYYDIVISISLSKKQNEKIEKQAKKLGGNKSLVLRNLIDKLK